MPTETTTATPAAPTDHAARAATTQPSPARTADVPAGNAHTGGAHTNHTHAGRAPAGHAPAPPHGYAKDRDAYLKRMRRIEGQVRGIERMIAEDVYCIDILTQVSAVTKALQAVSLGLVEDHLGHCVVNAAKSSEEEGAEKIREATDAIARLWKS
nr:metal-sensitive transcriptional regulator [Actinomycetales bacterium]